MLWCISFVICMASSLQIIHQPLPAQPVYDDDEYQVACDADMVMAVFFPRVLDHYIDSLSTA